VLQARLDWLLVSAILSRIALANYSLANRVVEVAMLVAGVLARTSFPWMSRSDADQPDLRARLALTRRVFVCFSVLLGVEMFYWVPILIHTLFGDKYAGAEAATRVMALVSALFMLNQYLVYVILARRRERDYTYVLFAATLLQVAVDLVLLPRFGLVGAALGMVAMGIAVHVGQLAVCVREHVIDLVEAVRLDAFLIATVTVVGVFWLSSVGPVVGSIGALVIGGVLGNMLLLQSADRRLLREYMVAIAGYWTSRPSQSGASY
jgi:O-antigen/teichoic acid export membrane protein